MRLNVRKWMIGTGLLTALGLLALIRDPVAMSAKEEVGMDEVKALLEEDSADIKKRAKGKESGANFTGIKADAMVIAALAQSQITGKNKVDDQKMATLRDTALKVVKLAKDKKLTEIAKEAEKLGLSIAPDPKASTKPVDYASIGIDIEDVMSQYKTTGYGIENAIKGRAGAKKITSVDAARILQITSISDTLTPDLTAKGLKPKWEAYNKDMKVAAAALLEETKKAKPDTKKLQSILTKVDGACVACHNDFKKE